MYNIICAVILEQNALSLVLTCIMILPCNNVLFLLSVAISILHTWKVNAKDPVNDSRGLQLWYSFPSVSQRREWGCWRNLVPHHLLPPVDHLFDHNANSFHQLAGKIYNYDGNIWDNWQAMKMAQIKYWHCQPAELQCNSLSSQLALG